THQGTGNSAGSPKRAPSKNVMIKIGRNDPCPCGSGKKYKKYCLGKKQRENTVMIESPECLRGVCYDHEKMEFMGISLEDRRIELQVTYSQARSNSDSGKENIITRIHN